MLKRLGALFFSYSSVQMAGQRGQLTPFALTVE